MFGNNKKGKMIKTIKRRSMYVNPKKSLRIKEYWHIFCERKKKYKPWDTYKRCFEAKQEDDIK